MLKGDQCSYWLCARQCEEISFCTSVFKISAFLAYSKASATDRLDRGD